jgi:nitroreductase
MDPRNRTWAEVNETRRSVTRWTGEVVTRDLVRSIVAEAHLAPSAFNGQPWRFAVAQGPTLDAVLEPLGGNGPKVAAAGTLVAVFVDMAGVEGKEGFYDGTLARTPEEWAARNGGLVAMNLLQAAWSHGVGSRPMIGFDPAGLRDGLGVPVTWHPVLIVALGWPDGDEPTPRSRVDVDEVLSFR